MTTPEYYSTSIKDMLKRVPDKVNAGSYQTAKDFKAIAVKALKYANSGKKNLEQLQTLHNQLAAFY